MYSLLDYTRYTLLLFGDRKPAVDYPAVVNVIHIHPAESQHYWAENAPYTHQAILVRPDTYIAALGTLDEAETLLQSLPV
ncbi:hypothetical protein P4S72_14660 [Vibrio sp. PP-XX7]